MVTTLSLRLLPTPALLEQEHHLAGQQPDNLCGPYWAAILLRAHGFTNSGTEQIALTAGSVLPIGDPVNWLPPAAKSRQDYRLPLPQTQQAEEAGTAVTGLIDAVLSATKGRYVLVPLRTTWSPERVEALMTLCWEHPSWEAVPLCNLRTGHLWGSRLLLSDVIAYLNGKEITIPAADWDTGHFLTLAGKVEGQEQSLILVRDTYPCFGWDGYHLQSALAIANALNRSDGHEGGVLLFVAAGNKAEVELQAQDRGFTILSWDNGTPI
ncbi:MAG: hypothetical protein JOZ78_02475 [Chroococcidiopsidaceae cyanobacterium CP_BM_ER_R8_30]|nr:hypothetical protein [Chroococcidiopsidaceae cyanobacterium CP_BM_ER_R8_30]